METEKKSFFGIMEILSKADDGLIDMAQAEMSELVGDLKGKIDGIKDILTRYAAESDRIKGQIDELKARKATLDNGAKRLKEYVAHTMTVNETTKLVGEMYAVSLRTKTGVQFGKEELNIDDYIALNSVQPGLVKNEYKLDKMAFSRLAAQNDEIMAAYGVATKTVYPAFTVLNKLSK